MGVGLEKADDLLAAAHDAALQLDWAAAIKSLAAAGSQIAALQKTAAQSQDPGAADLAWELEHERQKIDRALADAAALHIDARADKNELVAGESFKVNTRWTLRSRVGVTVNDAAVIAPPGWAVASNSASAAGDRQQEATDTISVPANAAVPCSPADAVLPWPPPLVRERLELTAGNYSFAVDEPVVYPCHLNKRGHISINASSRSNVDHRAQTSHRSRRSLRSTNRTTRARSLPRDENQRGFSIWMLRFRPGATRPTRRESARWLAGSAGERGGLLRTRRSTRRVSKSRRRQSSPPARIPCVHSPLSAVVSSMSRSKPLPSLPTRNWTEPTLATVHVVDLTVPKDLRVGYITVETDPLPEMLGQLQASASNASTKSN